MPSTTAFVPATLPAEFVASDATSLPFTGLTITSTEPVTSTQIIETDLTTTFRSDPTLTNPGTISDTTGGGTAISPTIFVEVNTIATTSGNTILGRLKFTPPVLKDGQSIEDNLLIVTATSLTPGGAIDSNVASLTVPIDVVTAPGISGTVATQPDGGSSLLPFVTTVIADADFKATGTDTAIIKITDGGTTPTDADGILTGPGLSQTGPGTYAITNAVSPATLTTELQGLKFTPTVNNSATPRTTSIELDVTDTKANLTNTDTITSVITPGDGKTPPPPMTALTVFDTTTAQYVQGAAGTAYTGPVTGITSQYININQDSLNITASTPNWFLHSGSGEDALQVTGGINVLDGGTNSNFLTGGTGAGSDTFFVDDRGATADIWSTMVNFHVGDAATVFGVTQAGFNFNWFDGQGAPGSTGLTLHVTAAGAPTASLTLPGYSTADLSNGKLAVSFGKETDGTGTPFMFIRGAV
jgi:hypothetical protein